MRVAQSIGKFLIVKSLDIIDMKFNNIFKLITISTFILFLGFGLKSCKENNEIAVSAGDALIKVEIGDITVNSEDITVNTKPKSANATRLGLTSNRIVQDSTVALGPSLSVDYVLENKGSIAKKTIQSTAKQDRSNQLSATSTPVRFELSIGTKYKLMAYTSAGLFVDEREYTYGSENYTPEFRLDAGKSYIFVAYSINSKTDPLPTVDGSTLSTAQLNNISKDLMFFKKQVTLTHGTNLLSVILKHRFSEITIHLGMDPSMTGAITQLQNGSIGATYQSANFKFSDESLTYNGNNDHNAAVTFLTGIGTRNVQSNATLLINPTTTDRVLTLNNITIDGETKASVQIPNIKVNPGHRYNLYLTFKTCVNPVYLADGALVWEYPELPGNTGIDSAGTIIPNGQKITKEFDVPHTDYGFTFEMTKLDNAFNMRINGIDILTDPKEEQIQFQTYDNTANGEGIVERNIRFIDGDEHGTSAANNPTRTAIPDIWKMQGTAANPILKVVISRTGKITIFGSKYSGGPLVEMVLKNNLQFNTVVWKQSGANNRAVDSQKVSNNTFVIGTGYGTSKVNCN
ncbi:hypothetical protein GQF61_03265 [Sphingobacterium sp. DK4209]|uniref:Fimbrillin family protein n=1 Tax=Sphingobacterium zhuxiongii TaxID=2662364 RepID=A0A5Q0Q6V5_9SPHI|nr:MULTISPECIES: hypothetical protein [unclassified Sphingobacterium]MVZ64857.1 hypothetical protein [Sphingobacterium sp. DK4209]QGA25203.1 hypothetical protein GFH32_02225 [Sphingobacterium sp. dk4302]